MIKMLLFTSLNIM